ncbi:hypothetical protein B6U98_05905 [Thermoplasmatales archaeon ex4572_165]|jgi:hypothetical protein|nr:MAG: hypothetical protein B6U98_05905 [Thermoplasmatales archaeon ex4572_165]
MPRKVIREVEDQIDYKGDLPAQKPVKGAGVAESPDTVWNGTTRTQDKLDTGNASNHSEDQKVLKLTKTTEAEDELAADDETGVVDNFPEETEEEPSAGSVRASSDSTSEARRNRLYHARVHKAENSAMRAIEAQKARVLAKQLKAQEARLDVEILKARESARPRLAVSSPKGGLTSGKVSATEAEVSKPSAWLRAVQRNQNVSPAYVWSINKEKIFENYSKQGIRSFDANDNEIITGKVKGSEAAIGNITGPAQSMRIMSEQVLVLPSGKVVTPIRQFCETKILPVGTKEAFFFDFGAVTFADIDEANDVINTATPKSDVIIRTSGTSTSPRGSRITIGYAQTEESPIDIIASANRAFALESINDESKQVLNAYNDDTANPANLATSKKAVGGGVKNGAGLLNHWIRGDTGAAIAADAAFGSLKYLGLLNAKGVIQDQGLDDTNLITYTSGKAIRDLTLDADLDTYIGYSKPAIITEATVERIAGTNLVRSSAVSNGSGAFAAQKRSVMFVPNVAFGLISGRDLTMEAQRRNELQAIHLTGTQKVAGLVKNVEATCRISHL